MAASTHHEGLEVGKSRSSEGLEAGGKGYAGGFGRVISLLSRESRNTVNVQNEINARLQVHDDELGKVTGADDDVPRDPKLAWGQSTLIFKDVSFSVNLGGVDRQILVPSSGHFEAGSLVALMGPSGCGKTTLLDILAGKKTSPHAGEVYLNGRARDHLWSRLTAYVPQQDIMPATCTVREAVLFNHCLKNVLPAKVKEETRCSLVDTVLKDLGLYHVRDSMIGDEQVRGISGGQRRRVTLARGFVAGAQIIFADEPTSGLSATDAEVCAKTMRLIAKKFGITIIVVIHQPRREVALLFDQLLLFTADPGRCVYNGPMSKAIAHWSLVGFPVPEYSNPTDHFLDMVTPGAPSSQVDAFVAYFEEHMKPTLESEVALKLTLQGPSSMELLQARNSIFERFGEVLPVRNSRYAVSFRWQLYYVFRRKLMLNLRDKRGIITEYLMAVFKAVIMGVGFTGIGNEAAQLQLAFVYMLMLAIAMSGMQAMPKLVDERMVMKMEVSDALYHETAYIMSVAVINTLVSVGANALFFLIMFSFGGMSWEIFPPFMMWALLTFITFDSLFAFIAAVAKNSQSAQATALPFLLLFVIYNGYLITKAACPWFMQWAIWISPAAYAIEAMAITCRDLSSGEMQQSWIDLVELYKFEDNRLVAVVVMISLIVIFRMAQVVALQKLNKIQR